MKKILYFVICLSTLISCSKNEIEIQKNADTSWEIDKSILEDDVRRRIGYDPRYEYGYLDELEIQAPMLSLKESEISLIGDITNEVKINFTNSLKKDVKLILEYDTSAFKELESKYQGYELGNESLVKIINKEKTFTQGSTDGFFELSFENNPSINKKYILPFTLKVKEGEDYIKIVDVKKTFVVKVYPEPLSFEISPKKLNKTAVLSKKGTKTMLNKEVSLTVSTKFPIPVNLSLGLVRDNSYVLPSPDFMPAPQGMEGTLPKVSIYNSQKTDLVFNLENIEALSNLGSYILPIKLVVYDESGKIYNLPVETYPITIRLQESNEIEDNSNNSKGSNSSEIPKGNILSKYNTSVDWWNNNSPDKSGFGLLPPFLLIDGQVDETEWFKSNSSIEQGFIFSFGKPEKIKTIRLRMKRTHTTNQISVLASSSMGGNNWKNQGVASFVEGQEYYVITFEEAIAPTRIALKDFRRTNGEYFEVYEVDFYGE